MSPRKRRVQGGKSKTKNQPTDVGGDALPEVTNQAVGSALSRTSWQLLAASCALSSLVLYWNTVTNDFVFDDLVAIIQNPDVRGERPLSFLLKSDFWGAPLRSKSSNKSYRPLTTWSFRMTALMHGIEPGPFHVTNVLLNALACTLAVQCVAIMSDGTCPSSLQPRGARMLTSFPVVTSILFVFHPVHTEDVACVVGRADLLGAIFGFLAFHCHAKCVLQSNSLSGSRIARIYFAACIVLSWISALSKETGLSILAICGAHEVARFWLPVMARDEATRENSVAASKSAALRASVVRFIALAGAGVAFLLFRRIINGPHTGIEPSLCDNPLLTAKDTRSYCLTALFVMTFYVWRLINPFSLLCDYGYNVIPLVEDLSDPRNLATLSLAGGLILLMAKGLRDAASKFKQDARLVMALAWIIVPLLPASHAIILGTVLAERLLFMPSLGYAMLLALFVEGCVSLLEKETKGASISSGNRLKRVAKTTHSVPSVSLAVLTVVLALFSQRIISRNLEWKNNRSLWAADYATKKGKDNVKIAEAYGSELELDGRLDEAWHVTKDLQGLGSYQRTEVCFVKARTTALSSAAGRNFSRAYEIIDECIKEAESLKTPTTNSHQLYATKAYILSAEGKFDDAVPLFKKAASLAAKIDPKNFQPICNLGEILTKVGRWDDSIAPMEKCVELSEKVRAVKQKRVVYMTNLAASYIKTNRLSEAENVLKASQRLVATKKATDWLELIRKKKQESQ